MYPRKKNWRSLKIFEDLWRSRKISKDLERSSGRYFHNFWKNLHNSSQHTLWPRKNNFQNFHIQWEFSKDLERSSKIFKDLGKFILVLEDLWRSFEIFRDLWRFFEIFEDLWRFIKNVMKLTRRREITDFSYKASS